MTKEREGRALECRLRPSEEGIRVRNLLEGGLGRLSSANLLSEEEHLTNGYQSLLTRNGEASLQREIKALEAGLSRLQSYYWRLLWEVSDNFESTQCAERRLLATKMCMRGRDALHQQERGVYGQDILSKN